MKSKEYFARDLYAKADTALFTFHLSVFTSLAARPNFLSEGVRFGDLSQTEKAEFTERK